MYCDSLVVNQALVGIAFPHDQTHSVGAEATLDPENVALLTVFDVLWHRELLVQKGCAHTLLQHPGNRILHRILQDKPFIKHLLLQLCPMLEYVLQHSTFYVNNLSVEDAKYPCHALRI